VGRAAPRHRQGEDPQHLPDGEVHFFGHAEVGARMFDKLDRRSASFAPEAALRTPCAS
jgi:hypothetical protein